MPGQQHSWERAPAAQPGLQAAEHSPGARLSKSQPLPSEADAGNCGGGWAARSSLLLQLLSAGGAARNGLGALQSAAPASLTEAGMWREREAHTKKKKKKRSLHIYKCQNKYLFEDRLSPPSNTRTHTANRSWDSLGGTGRNQGYTAGKPAQLLLISSPLTKAVACGGSEEEQVKLSTAMRWRWRGMSRYKYIRSVVSNKLKLK